MSKLIDINKKNSKNKIRVNITVDKEMLSKAKTKLDLFGGKLSTLFNAYLADFVDSMDKQISSDKKELQNKVKELEHRLKKMEDRIK